MKAKSDRFGQIVSTILAVVIFAGHALADLTLGSSSLSYASAKTLKTTSSLSLSLGKAPRFGFVGKVGGVAFDSTAKPEDGFTVQTLKLIYDASRPDGDRFWVALNGKPASTGIFDWQLVPIARYADSDSTSCFTLFGELHDSAEDKKLKSKGSRILNYDAAFENTLLGLRLFQLDVLLLSDDFSIDLPADGVLGNGSPNYLLGKGETAPDLPVARARKLAYDRALSEVQSAGASPVGGFDTSFQSYVICDQNVDIRFSVKEGVLNLTGEPYYYFWNSNQDSLSETVFFEEVIKAGIATENPENLQGAAKEQFEEKMAKVVEATRRRIASPEHEGKLQAAHLEEFGKRHTTLVPLLERTNPAVWNAGRVTMRYAAFFRYCKGKDPAMWKAFVGKLTGENAPKLQPAVKTPTVLTLPE